MSSAQGRFIAGFVIGVILFLILNLLAAHVQSDCGLPAVFGQSGCADDIVRVGFPLIFRETGGFAPRSIMDLVALLADVAVGLVLSILAGYLNARVGSSSSLA